MSFRIFSELQKTATITKLNLQLYKRKGKAKLLSFNVRSALLLTIIAALIIPSLNSNFTEANNLPVIQKTGTLQQDETWTAGNVYMVTGMVIVPDTVSLTVEQGAIVKFVNYYQANITVNTGGTLNATGTASDPVVFTSYKDDSIGGDSNGDGVSSGAVNDYAKSLQTSGGDINITHGDFRYATT